MFEAELEFSQVDVTLDDQTQAYSEWGSLDLRIPSPAEIQYLNLSVGNDWVIQNVPFEGLAPPGIPETFSILGRCQMVKNQAKKKER